MGDQVRHDALSPSEIVKKIDSSIAAQSSESPIAAMRRSALGHLKELILEKRLSLTEQEKQACCLMPLFFQELNYDGYSWADRQAPLGHLEEIIEIDVAVWSGGFQRSALTDLEYEQYRRFCHDAINSRQRQAKR
jgi:hypothetical protein